MKDWGEPMGYEEVISKLEQRIEDSREELRNIGYHHTVDYECEDLQIAIDAIKRMSRIADVVPNYSLNRPPVKELGHWERRGPEEGELNAETDNPD